MSGFDLRQAQLPQPGEDATEIRQTIREMAKVAIGRVVLTNREHIIALEQLDKGRVLLSPSQAILSATPPPITPSNVRGSRSPCGVSAIAWTNLSRRHFAKVTMPCVLKHAAAGLDLQVLAQHSNIGIERGPFCRHW
jgi:hypothetical protein